MSYSSISVKSSSSDTSLLSEFSCLFDISDFSLFSISSKTFWIKLIFVLIFLWKHQGLPSEVTL